jgi:transcriptional regulator with XRE-family HTH domain
MGQIDDTARRRVRAWMAARRVTKTKIAQVAGRTQAWASRWLAGDFDAQLDDLAKIAAHFGQPIAALFDQRPDPAEAELVELYRGLPPERQTLALDLLRDWSASSGATVRRKR